MVNVPFFFDGERKVFVSSAANRTVAFAVENPGAHYQEIGGSLYESDGAAWNAISIGGAVLTTDVSTGKASLGFYAITGFTSAKTLAEALGAAIPAEATMALIQAQGQNVRWKDDGTAPTASEGHQLLAGESRIFGNLDTLEFFQEAATATLAVNFY